MPSIELDFLPKRWTTAIAGENPTDEQLFLQLVYGLCKQLQGNPREEFVDCFVSAVDVPNPYIRRLAKLLVKRLNLPIPVERVDEWIEFVRHNQCWVVDDQMSAEVARLSKLDTQ